MKDKDLKDNECCEYFGKSIACLDTGLGLTGALVEYRIKFTPVGELKHGALPEYMTGICDEPFFVMPPNAYKKNILIFLNELYRKIEDDELIMPPPLFDCSGYLIGKIPE